jgi:hypothetical protein
VASADNQYKPIQIKELEMVLVSTNWRVWLAGTAASLVIFAVVYFAAIQPSMNTANQAIKAGAQQTQQAISQAQKQLGSVGGQSGAATGQAKQQLSKVTGQAKLQLSKAAQLTTCLSGAGTDPTKLEACQTKYAG